MSNREHKPGVSEKNLVKRHLKLSVPPGTEIKSLLTELDQLFGMDSVSFDGSKYMLHAAYDATQLNIGEIEKVLDQYDVQPSTDWWNSLKEEYYEFVDQNVKDNATSEPWSCHKVPPRPRR